MDKQPKARCDAVLKNLPEDRQREIVELLDKEGYKATRAHLIEDGLKTSLGSLSEFYSWWHWREQYQELEEDTQTVMSLLSQQRPDLKQEELEQYGSIYFQTQAVKKRDPKTFLRFATARHKAAMDKLNYKLKEVQIGQKDKDQSLAERKYQRETCALFFKWWEDMRVKQVMSGPESNEDKTEKLGQILFGENWQ
jgi:hypothetical protein